MVAPGGGTVIAILILVVAFAYAIIRYNILGVVGWEHLPLFISNKAIALSTVVFIGLSYVLGSLTRFFPMFASVLGMRKFLGLFGFGLASMHAFISVLIFSPTRYPRFFSQSGNLNLVGELSMLFGILAFFIFSIVALASVPGMINHQDREKWLAIQRIGYLGLILVFLHIFVMGRRGWIEPNTWPGGMIPINLIAAIIIAFVLLLRIIVVVFPKRNKN